MPNIETVQPSSDTPEEYAEVVADLSRAAWQSLEHLFGDGRSVLDPTIECWTAEVGEHLRSAIMDNLDEGQGSFLEKLQGQLDGADRALVLLAAETIRLHDLALTKVKPETKRGHVATVLGWLADPATVPAEVDRAFELPGALNGGAGFAISQWKHVVWLADLTAQVRQMDSNRRTALRSDPWAFRQFIDQVGADSSARTPSMRNALLFLMFPDTFGPVISDPTRRQIRDASSYEIGECSGNDPISVDRDLDAIQKKLTQGAAHAYIDWYVEPWRSIWWKSSKRADSRAWAVRIDGGEDPHVPDWVEAGFVSLPVDQIQDVGDGASRLAVREAVSGSYDHLDYVQQQRLTNDIFAFTTRMKPGDLVLARDGEEAYLGTINGPAHLGEDSPRLRRSVEWESDPIPASEIPDPDLLNQQRSVIDLTTIREELDALMVSAPVPETEDAEAPEGALGSALSLPRATDSLAKNVTIDTAWLDGFIDLLGRRRQVILYGPPGTGKTLLGRAIARHIAPETSRIVQFHPSYSYEDFFEGYRPTPLENGGVGFTLAPGPLRKMASEAAQHPGTPYLLLIDEINRGNIAKIFGELYFLLEYRSDHVNLQYSPDDQFSLPENLFIIGTMNTADRSIALVDAAIRRRFAFIEMDPGEPPVQGLLGRWLQATGADSMRADLLDALNEELSAINADLRVGPSYLMRPEAATDEGLADIWRYDILPLLEEQLYGSLAPADVSARLGLDALRRSLAPTSPAVEPQ